VSQVREESTLVAQICFKREILKLQGERYSLWNVLIYNTIGRTGVRTLIINCQIEELTLASTV